jgi:excisionase family DNA binding protein
MKFQKVMHISKGWEEGTGASRDERIERQIAKGPIPQHILDLRNKLKFFSPRELADFTSLSVWTIYEWIKDGKLKCQRMGRIVKVSSYDLADFLEEQNR